mmetsp:Transcript_67846/g.171073  ORF Transcript_67846/g.171073 Transcript_67846/m.171073 type:complete len:229 (-) Transcript_67846:681-1367(-)
MGTSTCSLRRRRTDGRPTPSSSPGCLRASKRTLATATATSPVEASCTGGEPLMTRGQCSLGSSLSRHTKSWGSRCLSTCFSSWSVWRSRTARAWSPSSRRSSLRVGTSPRQRPSALPTTIGSAFGDLACSTVFGVSSTSSSRSQGPAKICTAASSEVPCTSPWLTSCSSCPRWWIRKGRYSCQASWTRSLRCRRPSGSSTTASTSRWRATSELAAPSACCTRVTPRSR